MCVCVCVCVYISLYNTCIMKYKKIRSCDYIAIFSMILLLLFSTNTFCVEFGSFLFDVC